MNRAECLDFVYADLVRQQFIVRDVFDLLMHEWYVKPIVVDGQDVGVVCMRGTELHVTINKRDALLHARRIIRECIVNGILLHGHLTTRSQKTDVDVVRFLYRLGFIKTSEDADCFYYRIDTPKIH